MFGDDFLPGLPRHFATLRQGVDEHVPETAANACVRMCLVVLLGWAEGLAQTLVAMTPTPPVQQQHLTPLRDRSPVVEQPLVARRDGHDPRLPGRRPHP